MQIQNAIIKRKLKVCYLILTIILIMSCLTSSCTYIEETPKEGKTIIIRKNPPATKHSVIESAEPSYIITKNDQKRVISDIPEKELDSTDYVKHEKNIIIGEDFQIDGVMCQGVSLGYKKCIADNKQINITLRNGLSNIAGAYFRLYYSSNQSLIYTFDEDLAVKQERSFVVDLSEIDTTFDLIDKFEIFPVIKMNNTLKVCYNKKLYVSPFSCKAPIDIIETTK